MDWTKAKTILIIALIVTNMVLGINLYIDKKVMNTIGEDVIKETQIILKESKINIDTKKIPRKIKEMAVLDVEYDHIDSETINEMILNQSNRNRNELREKDVIQIAEDFLNQNGLLNKNTKLEDKDIRKEEDQYILPYKNFYEGIPLEECHMNCIIKNGQIIAIDRIWLNPIKQGKMKKRTIPSTTALLKFSTLKKEPAVNGARITATIKTTTATSFAKKPLDFSFR